MDADQTNLENVYDVILVRGQGGQPEPIYIPTEAERTAQQTDE